MDGEGIADGHCSYIFLYIGCWIAQSRRDIVNRQARRKVVAARSRQDTGGADVIRRGS